MNASFDKETGSYYFNAGDDHPPITKTIELGSRHVLLDVDIFGNICGVEIL